MNDKKKGIVKFILDFTPVILFFIAFKANFTNLDSVVFASLVLTASTVLSLIISYILKIKPDKFGLYTNIGVIFFGLLTVVFNNPGFIKAKLTILNLIFGFAMIFFYIKKKPVIKILFKDKIIMEDKKWNILNLRFSLLFFTIASLNFYFWYFTSENAWVNFKTFGVLPVTFIFFIFQMRFILRNGSQKNLSRRN